MTARTQGAAINGAAAETPPDIRAFEIPRPKMRNAIVHVVSDSPLIMHKWSEKALRTLEDSQTGKPKSQRAPKVPMEEALAAAYIVPGQEAAENAPGKFCFPSAAFKHAFLYGVGQLDDVRNFPKTRSTAWLFINRDPVLDFAEITMRTDVTRNPTQVTYRLMFGEWKADLDVSYNSLTITIEQVASLFDLGGVGGIGEWRPSAPKNKAGSYGRFHVAGVTER